MGVLQKLRQNCGAEPRGVQVEARVTLEMGMGETGGRTCNLESPAVQERRCGCG